MLNSFWIIRLRIFRLYMDETNFNLFISRKKGRSKRGNRSIGIAAGNKGSNIYLIGCIGNIGLNHHEI